jgi:hypothetical protein
MFARALASAVLLVAACSANDDVPAPGISAVTPGHGVPGTFVTVTGNALCQQPRDSGEGDPLACAHLGSVLFGATPGSVTMYADTMVMAEVPQLAPGKASVVVTVAGRSSNSVDFVVE